MAQAVTGGRGVCAKCNSSTIEHRWHRNAASCLWAFVLPVAFFEHMHAYCHNCGFSWKAAR